MYAHLWVQHIESVKMQTDLQGCDCIVQCRFLKLCNIYLLLISKYLTDAEKRGCAHQLMLTLPHVVSKKHPLFMVELVKQPWIKYYLQMRRELLAPPMKLKNIYIYVYFPSAVRQSKEILYTLFQTSEVYFSLKTLLWWIPPDLMVFCHKLWSSVQQTDFHWDSSQGFEEVSQ